MEVFMLELANIIFEAYKNRPRDVSTNPLGQNKKKRWFYVYTKQNKILVSRAKYHSESSQLKTDRILDVVNADKMLALYSMRKNNVHVSKKASSISVNQAYWYGIFHDLQF